MHRRLSGVFRFLVGIVALASLGQVDTVQGQSQDPDAGGIFVDSGQNLGDSDSTSVALGDLDSDGDLDAFVANYEEASRVWLNDGTGTFLDSGQMLGLWESNSVALGDIDGDGDLDAFVANGYGSQANIVWMNDGAGSFTDSGQRLGSSASKAVVIADLDDDSDLDAFVGNWGGGNRVWMNDGAGNFTDSGQRLGDQNSWAVALADLDGDGDLDAFVGNGNPPTQPNKVWLNDGAGVFFDSGQNLGNDDTLAVALADLDADRDIDAYVANTADGPNLVWMNTGDGTFYDSGQELGVSRSRGVTLGDVDGDADADAFVANFWGFPSRVWLNDGVGLFIDSGQELGVFDSSDADLADLDGDGDLDAFLANSGQQNKVYFNQGDVDLGLRPNPDGYKFSNYTNTFPVTPADFSMLDMRRMFGDDCVCQMQGGGCAPRPAAQLWWYDENMIYNAGHCYGMATSSLRLFKAMGAEYEDEPGDFQTGATTTYELNLPNIRNHIMYYNVIQDANPVSRYIEEARNKTLATVLGQLASRMVGDALDPAILVMYSSPETGHAVTPYRIEDRSGGLYWVRVYDNEYPDDYNLYVVIDTVADGGLGSWYYDWGGHRSPWSGGGHDRTLAAIPISMHSGQMECPWNRVESALDAVSFALGNVRLLGQGHLLITDSQGRRIGYDGDGFVSEIPGAYESTLIAGPDAEVEPSYNIPLTQTYTLLLDGNVAMQPEAASISQFGPGHAVLVSDIELEPDSQHLLAIAPDGTEVAVTPGTGIEPMVRIALEEPEQSREFLIAGADAGAGDTVALRVDVNAGQLIFNNEHGSGGTYVLSYRLLLPGSMSLFVHYDLEVWATDTHLLDYGAWDGFGPITLHIDHGSDSYIDEVIELENQVKPIYLPVVLRGA